MPCIHVDTEQNVLRLVLHEPASTPVARHALPAILDVGERGRLLGIEIDITTARDITMASVGERTGRSAEEGTIYVPLEPAAETAAPAYVRSVDTTVGILTDVNGEINEVQVPRRGAGYEITYPSGKR